MRSRGYCPMRRRNTILICEVFERFNVDKQWSFTDCVSYVVMKQNEIEEAFAFDHHFEQMGFVRRP